MEQKQLSPDAQYIMDMLYKMLDKLGQHKYLNKKGLEYFITKLEENLGVIR